MPVRREAAHEALTGECVGQAVSGESNAVRGADAVVAAEVCRFPGTRCLRMPGSTTTRGRRLSLDHDARSVAFCRTEDIGTPKLVFAAQWLAYALPYQRFATALTGPPRMTHSRSAAGRQRRHPDDLSAMPRWLPAPASGNPRTAARRLTPPGAAQRVICAGLLERRPAARFLPSKQMVIGWCIDGEHP
jgi:hypothetical protein